MTPPGSPWTAARSMAWPGRLRALTLPAKVRVAAMGQGQGIAPEAPNGGPQARRGICCTRHLVQLVDKCLARTSRSHYLLRFRGEGQHKPVPDGCSPAMSHKGRKCHVCCSLTTAAARPVSGLRLCRTPCRQQQRSGPRPHPGPSRDPPRWPHGKGRQRKPVGLVDFPSKLIDPSDSRCRLARTSRAAISTWGSCWYLQPTRPIPPQKRPSDGYAPG
jgi:hypothetical protein